METTVGKKRSTAKVYQIKRRNERNRTTNKANEGKSETECWQFGSNENEYRLLRITIVLARGYITIYCENKTCS